jgi:hypothetical protein
MGEEMRRALPVLALLFSALPAFASDACSKHHAIGMKAPAFARAMSHAGVKTSFGKGCDRETCEINFAGIATGGATSIEDGCFDGYITTVSEGSIDRNRELAARLVNATLRAVGAPDSDIEAAKSVELSETSDPMTDDANPRRQNIADVVCCEVATQANGRTVVVQFFMRDTTK